MTNWRTFSKNPRVWPFLVNTMRVLMVDTLLLVKQQDIRSTGRVGGGFHFTPNDFSAFFFVCECLASIREVYIHADSVSDTEHILLSNFFPGVIDDTCASSTFTWRCQCHFHTYHQLFLMTSMFGNICLEVTFRSSRYNQQPPAKLYHFSYTCT